MAKFGFNRPQATRTEVGTAFGVPRIAEPLVKYGGGDIDRDPGGGGGGNLPNGCPKSVGWWWIPLGCAGVMQFVAWILARK